MKKEILSIVMISVCLFAIIVSPLATSVYASTPAWTVTLSASVGAYKSQPTILGVADNATDGFDTEYDAVLPPPPPTGVESYFWYPTNPSSPVDLRKLSTSIIPPSGNMNWTYKVHTIGVNGTVLIKWTNIPPQYNAYMIDSNGTILADMTTLTQYSYTQDMDVTITFTMNFVPEFPTGLLLIIVALFPLICILKKKTARMRVP